MELQLTRFYAIKDATIGVLAIDGAFACFTLEDEVRPTKIKHTTAIPAGRYNVLLTESPRFSNSYEKRGLGRIVPLLADVPNYTGVRIHVGNYAKDTDGCILVGDWTPKLGAMISGSKNAFLKLMKQLNGAGGMIAISVQDKSTSGDGLSGIMPKAVFDAVFPVKAP